MRLAGGLPAARQWGGKVGKWGTQRAQSPHRENESWQDIDCQLLHVHAEVGGYSVDVGVVETSRMNERRQWVRAQREIDFVVNRPGTRVYVQSAWAMPDDDKRERELKAFSLTGDSFRKIVVRNDIGRPWQDERGVLHVGLCDFLLDETLMG